MLSFDFDDIDIYDYTNWPLPIKVIVVFIGCVIFYYITNWLFVSSKVEELLALKEQEEKQREIFQEKQNALFDIKDYKEQIKTIEKRLAKVTKKLPGVNEVPNLINQISQAGQISKLKFKEIKILPEKKFKYYVELPIKITVEGNYHEFGDFIGKVSSMSRVITFHDLKMELKGNKDLDVDNKLDMEVLAKTYRYLTVNNDEEIGNDANKAVKPKKAKK